MNPLKIVAEISANASNSTFVTLHDYVNNKNEISDYNIVFGIDYKNALESSISILNNFKPTNDSEKSEKNRLLTQYKRSLSNISDKEENCIYFTNNEGKTIKGIKFNTNKEELYLFGRLVNKRLKNKRAFATKKGSKVEQMCPAFHFRQFTIKDGKLSKIAINNKKIAI